MTPEASSAHFCKDAARTSQPPLPSVLPATPAQETGNELLQLTKPQGPSVRPRRRPGRRWQRSGSCALRRPDRPGHERRRPPLGRRHVVRRNDLPRGGPAMNFPLRISQPRPATVLAGAALFLAAGGPAAAVDAADAGTKLI